MNVLARALIALGVALELCVLSAAFVPISASRAAVAAPPMGLCQQHRNSIGVRAPGCTRLARRARISDVSMLSKKEIWSYVIAAGSAFFILNVAESAINDQFNLWPELKGEWNYSGSNDAICAKMEIEEPELFKTTKLCTAENRAAAAEKLALKQKYYESQRAAIK
mmetsp:Transcript_33867/g.58111  ORF Transcript_33867/g.58111 Transcript_33867/m.58111 type:complete len:166 (-) Transcript_33867:629-1126(-)|eukprot:CAMPEP_0205915342 /NCGR_PEP_ID=MMETSP1325-20131115/7811_1 /ASSEMBLY_ACC=CAM_ASM_000708 /TAXON_ID=236786 /ORGANISM="Florenciella sp., Strain RCC1007" /LENGTH=165 /DNA_ID=CAMNT_0053282507 /DNA_START=34 /DNA_END=531 /DNA_ORIENTATION=-